MTGEAPYTFSQEDGAPESDVQQVRDGLFRYNEQFLPADDYATLRLFIRDADGRIVGGLLGETYWGWLHVNILWLDESIRRAGHGSRLLAMAEAEGLRRGRTYAFLDTLTIQARPFYEKQGYELFATQDEYPAGTQHQRFFMKKRLRQDDAASPPIS